MVWEDQTRLEVLKLIESSSFMLTSATVSTCFALEIPWLARRCRKPGEHLHCAFRPGLIADHVYEFSPH